MSKSFVRNAVAVAALVASSASQASLLGETVNVDFYFPDQSTLYCNSGTAVVGAGIEYAAGCSGFGPVSIDISDTQLIVNTGGVGWATGAFNGFLLDVLGGWDFTSAIYDSGSMNVTSLQLDNGNLWVNFAGQLGGQAVIDIAGTNNNIPEPATAALLGMALLGLAGARRRRS